MNTAAVPERAELERARAFLETRWVSPKGQCIRAAVFVRECFGGTVTGGWWCEGGRPSGRPAGYRDDQGEWHFHYWTVLLGQVIDLTADQFSGGSAVTLRPAPDAAYRFRRGAARQIAEDTRDVQGVTVGRWLSEYRATLY